MQGTNNVKILYTAYNYNTFIFDIFVTAIGLAPGGSSTVHFYT